MSEVTQAAVPSAGEAIERANQLREAVNGSASLVRNLFFTFLLLGTYIAVTIGSTTDEQLLRVSPVTLPILDVDLPIVAFYAVIPWLLVLFHFNLLLQLYLLARQLHLFNAAIAAIADERERRAQRIRLFPFPFVHMLAGASDARVTRMLFSLVVWATVVWLPLALLVSVQVRFLPYHDPVVIGWNRLAVLLDLALLWTFWPLIVSPGARPAASWWRSAMGAPKHWLAQLRAAHRRLRHGELQDRRADSGASGAPGWATLLCTSIVALGFSSVVAVVPGEPIEEWLAAMLPAPGSDQNSERREPLGNLLTYWVFDGPGAPLHRNLELAEHVLLAKVVEPELLSDLLDADDEERAAALARVSGIDLSGRDLRYANLHRAILPRADLRGADLDGADLRRADLSAADLRPLEIEAAGGCVDEVQRRTLEEEAEVDRSGGQYVAAAPQVCVTTLRLGARLSEARLSGASMNLALFDGADFRDAELDRADLRGAVLTAARFDQADVRNASLNFANLSDANLTGTTLDHAEARRVMMSGAILEGTSLRHAKLNAAGSEGLTVEDPDLTYGSVTWTDLRGAHVEKGEFANFFGSDLRGAQLAGGDFQGASFGNSDLRKANLSGADLRGANFEGADLSGADLRGARLDLAKFIRMSACRANFSKASMRGADFYNVALRGATLQGANLDLASFDQVDARALDARGARINATDIYDLEVDYGDLRSLAGDPTRGVQIPELSTLASELRSNERRMTDRQEEEVLARAESGTPLRDSPHPDAVSAEAPVLCDDTTATLVGSKDKQCLAEDALLEYVDIVTTVACDDRDIAAGVLHRLERPAEPLVNRAGIVIETPPVEEYTRLLAAGLAKSDCPALTTLEQDERQLLVEVLQRSNVAIPSVLADPAPIPPQSSDPPRCEYIHRMRRSH